jgi:lycopene cyclase domain-containing protein
MYFYLLSNLILLVIALLLEYIYHEHLFKHLAVRLMWVFLFFILGLTWDIYGLYFRNWVFTGKGILGLYVWIVPIEDFLWLLIVPYFCLTVYKTFHIIFNQK